MQPIQFFAARAEDGVLLPGATVHVYSSGTSILTALFSDAEATVPLANPTHADASARVFFYAKERRIDVSIGYGGYVAPLLKDIVTTDPEDILNVVVEAADRAEIASSQAQLSAGIFATTALGLAGTVSGKYFSVPTADNNEYLILYQNSSGVAIEVKRYPSAAAVSGVTSRVASIEPPVKSLSIQVGKNLYNNATQVAGGSFNTTTGGDTAPGGSWYRSEYIPVAAGTTYKFSLAAVPAAANMAYAFYTAAKAFISGAGGANSVSAPAGAAYLRVSFNWAGPITAIVAADALPGQYVPYRLEMNGNSSEAGLYIGKDLLSKTLVETGSAIVAGLSPQLDYVTERHASFIDTSSNLFDYRARIIGKNISSTNGLEVNVEGWWATGFIPVVNDGATYRSTTKSSTINVMPQPQFSTQGVTGAWYDADKRFLAGIVNLNSMTAPADAAYIRISSNSASPEKIMFTKGADLPIRYEPYHSSLSLTRVTNILPPFWGKKWCALGDSFTQLNLYAAKLCEVTGLQQTKNLGVSGQLLRTMADNLAAGDLDEIDVVTTWGGTNDYGHGNCLLGTLADPKETISIHGNVRYLIDKILTIKPTVQLFFFTPTNRGQFGSEPVPPALNSYGLSIQSIGKAMIDVCREMGVPCLDIGGQCCINSYNLSIYTTDNLHPNQLGADILGNLMGRFINNR
ncbi:SGNH/GDSL hydrolase family protein [Pseudomonas pergaminensis]|jgi:lysophospholipase L1-like esterase